MEYLPLASLGRRLAAPLLICFALAVAAAPAQAMQGWQAPVGLHLKTPVFPYDAIDPAGVALAPAGGATVIDGLGRAESNTPSVSWGAPASVLGGGQVQGGGFPIVTDNAGDFFTAWAAKGASCGVAVQVAAKRVSTGSWGTPVTVWETSPGECLEKPTVSGIRIAANARADLVLAWQTTTTKESNSVSAVRAATKPTSGKWTAAQALAPASESEPSGEQQAAIDGTGAATVVWRTGSQILLASSPAGGSWSEPEQLAAPSAAKQPAIAVDPAGETLVAWCSLCQGSELSLIEVVSKSSAGGPWSAPETLSEPVTVQQSRTSHPMVALDAAGNATVIWCTELGGRLYLRAAWRPAGGTWGGSWGKSTPIGGRIPKSQLPSLAVNSGGDAIVAWRAENSHIRAALRPRGSGWQTTITLSGPAEALKSAPHAAIDRAGNAVVTWGEGRADSPNGRQYAAEYYAIPHPVSAPVLLTAVQRVWYDDNTVKVGGSAAIESTIDLYANPTCSGAPVVSGTGAVLNETGDRLNPPGLTVTVADNTTTSFYATATEEGETSSCSGPITYSNKPGPVTLPEALAKMPALDTMLTPEDPLSREGAWSTMHGAVGPGYVGSGGWSSHEPFPAVEAAYWSPAAFNDGEEGTAVSARVIASPGVEKRYFSLWLEMPKPATNKTGYELRFSVIGHNAYNAELRSWTNGAPTPVTTVEDVVLPSGSLAALVDQGGSLSIWVDAGAGYVELGSIADSQFDSGYAGIAANGNGTGLRRFAAGELPPIAP